MRNTFRARRDDATHRRQDNLFRALDHGRSLFEYHANQRHASIRFYFIALALGLAGAPSVLTSEILTNPQRSVALVAIGFVIGFVSICFWLLDLRNACLVNCDENLLRQVELNLSKELNLPELNTVFASDVKERPPVAYSDVMAVMCLFFFLVGILIMVVGFNFSAAS